MTGMMVAPTRSQLKQTTATVGLALPSRGNKVASLMNKRDAGLPPGALASDAAAAAFSQTRDERSTEAVVAKKSAIVAAAAKRAEKLTLPAI